MKWKPTQCNGCGGNAEHLLDPNNMDEDDSENEMTYSYT